MIDTEGLYLVDSNGDMNPVHTAEEGCDIESLRQYLQWWDLPGIEVTEDE